MQALIWTCARSRFEAARQLHSAPDGHRVRSLHGHSFRLQVLAALPSGTAAFAGGDAIWLHEQLAPVVRRLNYVCLNDVMAEPSDDHLACWLTQQLQPRVPGLASVVVQSTPEQGVTRGSDGLAQFWRSYQFEAAHRLPHVPAGHKCGRMHGHGFKVVLHAHQAAGLDGDALDALWAPLAQQLNYQCLNEIDGLSNPTSEMLASWVWSRLKPRLPQLSWVSVFETASCGAHFDGDQYRIWKDFTIDSATQLRQAPVGSPYSRLHGHTYVLRLHLQAPLNAVLGWTMDFGDVKAVFDPVYRALDHQPLHELKDLANGDMAHVAQWIFQMAQKRLPPLVQLDVYATNHCGVVLTQNSAPSPVLPF
jgi:6-pyruvoyltetrahydropterin/6-carboxytetrahydropterin synthase